MNHFTPGKTTVKPTVLLPDQFFYWRWSFLEQERARTLGSHCSFPHIPGRSLEWRSSCFSRAGSNRTFFCSLPGQICSLVFISKPGNLHIGRDGTTDSGDESFWGAHGSLLLPTWREGMWNRILLSLFEDSSCIAILSPVPWSHLNPPNYIIYNHPELGWDNIVPLQWRIVAAKQRTWIWWQNWARNSGDPEVKLRVLLSSGISVVDRSLQMEPA